MSSSGVLLYESPVTDIPDFMLNTLGVRNVVESDEEWPIVSWETNTKTNPTFLVITHMDRRRLPADDYEKKLEFLRSDPVTSNMDAVKNNRIFILDAMAMKASVRIFDGLETLATAINGYDCQNDRDTDLLTAGRSAPAAGRDCRCHHQ